MVGTHGNPRVGATRVRPSRLPLFVTADIAWADPVFPAWSLIVSICIPVVSRVTGTDAAGAS